MQPGERNSSAGQSGPRTFPVQGQAFNQISHYSGQRGVNGPVQQQGIVVRTGEGNPSAGQSGPRAFPVQGPVQNQIGYCSRPQQLRPSGINDPLQQQGIVVRSGERNPSAGQSESRAYPVQGQVQNQIDYYSRPQQLGSSGVIDAVQQQGIAMRSSDRNPSARHSGSGAYHAQGQLFNHMGYCSGPQQKGASGINDPVYSQRSVEQAIPQLGAHDGAATASQNYGLYHSPQQQLSGQTGGNPTASKSALERLLFSQPVGSASPEAPTRSRESEASLQQAQYRNQYLAINGPVHQHGIVVRPGEGNPSAGQSGPGAYPAPGQVPNQIGYCSGPQQKGPSGINVQQQGIVVRPDERSPSPGQSGPWAYPVQGQVQNQIGYYSRPQHVGPRGINGPVQQQGIVVRTGEGNPSAGQSGPGAYPVQGQVQNQICYSSGSQQKGPSGISSPVQQQRIVVRSGEGNPSAGQSAPRACHVEGQVFNQIGYCSSPQQIKPKGINDPIQQQGIVEHAIPQRGAHDGAAPASQNYGLCHSSQQQLSAQTGGNPTASTSALEGRLLFSQPVGSASPEAPTRSRESEASLQQPQSSPGPNPPPTSAVHQQPPQTSDKSNQLNPPPYSPEILNNLGKYSVTKLCTIGSEIVHEINLRTTELCWVIRAICEGKPVRQNPEVIVKYCIEMLGKLQEIRILIEKQRQEPDERAGSILERFMDTTDSDIQKPELLQKKELKFEENRKKLVSLGIDLKFLDWKAAVSDPVHLRNVDSMSVKDYKDEF